MMAIPTQSFKHAKVSPKNLFAKKLGCSSIYRIYVKVRMIILPLWKKKYFLKTIWLELPDVGVVEVAVGSEN